MKDESSRLILLIFIIAIVPAVSTVFSLFGGTKTMEGFECWCSGSSASTQTLPIWQTPTLTNNWSMFGAPYSTPGYMMDSFGFVHLRGLVKGGTVTGDVVTGGSGTMFTLPVGMRPSNCLILPITGANSFGSLRIGNDGTVFLDAGSTSWVSLDGIVFSTVA